MRAKFSLGIAVCAAVLLPLTTLADNGNGDDKAAISILLSALPFVFFAFILWFVIRRTQKSPAALRQQQHVIRSEQHMERVEALLERLSKAVEDKNTGTKP